MHARLIAQPDYEAQFRRLQVKVGSATVVPGQTTALELRLPVETSK